MGGKYLRARTALSVARLIYFVNDTDCDTVLGQGESQGEGGRPSANL